MVKFTTYTLFFILITFVEVTGQLNRYIVYFKDKTGTPFSVDQPQQFLSQTSIQRRAKQGIAISEEDLPVNPAYRQQVKALGIKTFFSSRWLNCILIEANESAINALSLISSVKSVEYVAQGHKLLGGRLSKSIEQKNTFSYNAATVQYQQLGIDQMQQQGFHGEGINIAIFDGGFIGLNTASQFQAAISQGKIKNTYNFVENSQSVFSFDEHGTEVFSILAAQSADFTGGVYAANFFLFITEDVGSENRIEEYNWLFAAERADSLGVDVISSSLGYSTFDDPSMDYQISDLDGKTAIVSKAASKAIEKGMMVVNSAGNEGNGPWKFITCPADVKGILTVGSVTSQGQLSSFSSVGPTADKRIKPDVVAIGSGTTVIGSSGFITQNSGTSFSCPLVTCLAAGVWQAHPTFNVSQLYWSITKSASQALNPDYLKGYGIPNFVSAQEFIQSLEITDDIALSPNPVVNNLLKITFKQPKDDNITATIYDLRGHVLHDASYILSWENNPIEFDLSLFAAGIYIVKIKTSGAVYTSRIVKL